MSSTPGLHNVHYNAMLTNFVQAEIQDDDIFIARKVFKSVPVPFQSNNWYSVVDQPFNSTQAAPLAPGAESVGKDFQLKNDNFYLCKVYALHHDMPDQIAANVDSMLNLNEMIARLLKRDMLLQQEVAWTNKYFRPNVWKGFSFGGVAQDFDVSNVAYSTGQWDVSNSDPIVTIDLIRSKVASGIGFKPNVAVISDNVFRALKNHPLLIERYKAGPAGESLKSGQINEQMLAQLMGLDAVYVPSAIISSSEEGQAEHNGFIQDNGMLLVYVPQQAGLMTAMAGCTFEWSNYANGMSTAIENFRIETHMKTRYRSRSAYDMVLVQPRLGVFLTNILAKPDIA